MPSRLALRRARCAPNAVIHDEPYCFTNFYCAVMRERTRPYCNQPNPFISGVLALQGNWVSSMDCSFAVLWCESKKVGRGVKG